MKQKKDTALREPGKTQTPLSRQNALPSTSIPGPDIGIQFTIQKKAEQDTIGIEPQTYAPPGTDIHFTIQKKEDAIDQAAQTFHTASTNTKGPVQRKESNHLLHTITPVVQRKLNETDNELFLKWLTEQNFHIGEHAVKRICLYSNSLEEAKEQATTESEVYEKTHKKRQVSLTKAESAIKRREGTEEPDMDEWQQVLADLSAPGLGDALPAAITSLARVLFAHYPPQNHTYVMMGNSPAPLMAFLEINRIKSYHFPLGGITDVQQASQQFKNDIQQSEKLIHGYLEQVLGAAVDIGKPLVLIDYVSSGSSMILAMDLIKSWIGKRERKVNVDFFGFTNHKPDELKNLMKGSHSGVLATAVGKMERTFIRMMAGKDYKQSLMLKGPCSMEMATLLSKKDPATAMVNHVNYYKRLVQMMLAELAKH